VNAQSEQSLNVVIKGSGSPPLVMLHGWGQTLGSLFLLGDLISKSRAVYLIDLPGFGASANPPSDWGTAEIADRILAYLHTQNLQGVDILGHSFGGRVALHMATKEPKLFRKLVLVNSAGLKREVKGKRALRASLVRTSLAVCRFLDSNFGMHTFDEFHVPRFASPDYKNAGELRPLFVRTVNEDLTEVARQVTQPVLLLWGEKDEETPVELANRFHNLLPNSQLTVLPGKDHFPFMNEGAHLCAYHILRFLDSDNSAKQLAMKGELSCV